MGIKPPGKIYYIIQSVVMIAANAAVIALLFIKGKATSKPGIVLLVTEGISYYLYFAWLLKPAEQQKIRQSLNVKSAGSVPKKISERKASRINPMSPNKNKSESEIVKPDEDENEGGEQASSDESQPIVADVSRQAKEELSIPKDATIDYVRKAYEEKVMAKLEESKERKFGREELHEMPKKQKKKRVKKKIEEPEYKAPEKKISNARRAFEDAAEDDDDMAFFRKLGKR